VMGGVTAVTLANNHSLDFGREGLLETLALLDEHRIEHVGAGVDQDEAHRPLIIERNGVRVAVLSYVLPFNSKAGWNTREWEAKADLPGVAIGRPSQVDEAISAARHAADVVIVVVHSGGEFRPRPKRNQIGMARAALDAGATLVIGHGPHNLQGYVRKGKTMVAYSIGNFVFDDYTGPQNDTAILDVTLSAEGIEKVAWIPVEIEDGVPRPASAEESERIMRQLALDPVPHD
jgi:poly-gamma-glutamate capsule biosynthesis protein CapA/YwtB (metallophosphatase superfamily)